EGRPRKNRGQLRVGGKPRGPGLSGTTPPRPLFRGAVLPCGGQLVLGSGIEKTNPGVNRFPSLHHWGGIVRPLARRAQSSAVRHSRLDSPSPDPRTPRSSRHTVSTSSPLPCLGGRTHNHHSRRSWSQPAANSTF